MNSLVDNTRLLQWRARSAVPAQVDGPGVFAYGSGREALLAWIRAQQQPAGQPLTALLPAYLPEGIYAPFSRAGLQLIFYNIDADGDPQWAEIAQLCGQYRIDLAVIIHYFGGRRDSARFRALLPPGALLLDDWAHTYPGYAPPGAGDWLLYSANKLAALPDGAWLIRQGGGSSPQAPHTGFSGLRLAYLGLRWAYLLSASLSKRWPWLQLGRVLKRLSSRAYLWSYRLLQRSSRRPGKFSRAGAWLWRHSPHEAIVESRKRQWQGYAAGIQSSSSYRIMAGMSPDIPAIGFPIWVDRRPDLHQYLLAQGVQGVYYTDGWWFAEGGDNKLKDSRLFWSHHYLLPINPALSDADISRVIGLLNAWGAQERD